MDDNTNSVALSIPQAQDLLDAGASYEEAQRALFSELITYEMTPEYQEKSDAKVLQFYMDNFKQYKGNVSLEDVMQDVFNYNYEIVYNFSEYEFNTGQYDESSFRDYTYDEIISEITGNNLEVLEYDHFQNLTPYVEELLQEHGFGFYYETVHDVYEHFRYSDDIRVIFDCQNLLFAEFINEGQRYMEGYCSDYKSVRVVRYEEKFQHK